MIESIEGIDIGSYICRNFSEGGGFGNFNENFVGGGSGSGSVGSRWSLGIRFVLGIESWLGRRLGFALERADRRRGKA